MSSIHQLHSQWLRLVGIAVNDDPALMSQAEAFANRARDFAYPGTRLPELFDDRYPPKVPISARLLAEAHRKVPGAAEALGDIMLQKGHEHEDVLGHPGDDVIVAKLQALRGGAYPWVPGRALVEALGDFRNTAYPARPSDWLSASGRRGVAVWLTGQFSDERLRGRCISAEGTVQWHVPDGDGCGRVWYALAEDFDRWADANA